MVSHGPILFSASAVPASGTYYAPDCHGEGPVRVFVKNVGAEMLSSCPVLGGPDSDHLATLDSFSNLGAGDTAQLFIDRPVHILGLSPSGATQVDLIVTSAGRP